MDVKYQVYEWGRDATRGQDYRYHLEWEGHSLVKALWRMWQLKQNGACCLKLEWRKA